FVFHLLTRSGRIDYGNLRLRDPYLIEEVDRWFAHKAGAPDELRIAPPPSFARFETRGVVLDNRLVVAAAPCEDAVEGVPGTEHLSDLRSALRSGAGLVLTDEVAVSAHARITPGDAGLWDKSQAEAWSRALEGRVARAGVRLNHSGRRGATRPRGGGLDRPLVGDGWRLLAPSALAYGANAVPFAMSEPSFEHVKEDFVAAAGRALQAGFDLVVLEMARGYLLGSFLSPVVNRRDDSHGGSLGNRARWPLEVFDAVREAWPGPLAVSVCATDWERGGTALEEAIAFVRWLKERGCDLVEVTAGQTTPKSGLRLDPYYLTLYSERIRNECGIRTLVGGEVTTVDRANTIVGGARADLCLVRVGR
ncbi:MAG: bifunctional salicylyl-CoA 5-hydroxylase/oxidoreductase, partial [Actinomycetota bacterium]